MSRSIARPLLLAATLALAACRGEPVPSEAPHATEAVATAPSTPAPHATALSDIGEARRARDGSLRFADEVVHDNPAAAAELLRRFDGEPDAEVRAALVEALPGTGGEWLDAVLLRFRSEPEARVRKAMVAIAPRAPEARASELVSLGLDDGEPSVRAEGCLAVGSLHVGAAGATARLVALLADGDARVRASAVRTLGLETAPGHFDAIAALLRDADAFVRLEVVRALGRLDRPRAAALPALQTLRTDPDGTVAGAAARLLDGPAP